MIDIRCGDCLALMPGLADNSIDAIVTDPPYGLEFMGKEWDKLAKPKPGNLGGFADGNKPSFERVKRYLPAMQEWHYRWAVEALRVAKPGAHLLTFGGDRTHHRLMCALEDAGWEIRTCIAWIFGSGFPKSLNVGKAIDKAAGATREMVGQRITGAALQRTSASGEFADGNHGGTQIIDVTLPATDLARQWDGWGTALKPSWEIIVVARKPLDGTVAENVQAWGTGALNIDGCRVSCNDKAAFPAGIVSNTEAVFGGGNGRYADRPRPADSAPSGRWPANLIHDGSEEVLAGFPQQTSYTGVRKNNNIAHGTGPALGFQVKNHGQEHNDTGSAARFFYCAKASRADRDEGLEDLPLQEAPKMSGGDFVPYGRNVDCTKKMNRNSHPCVKPCALMRWLCRLVTPPGGMILDPFMGSGSTGKAAVLEGFSFIGIDSDADYCKIARRRIEYAQKQAQAQLALPLEVPA